MTDKTKPVGSSSADPSAKTFKRLVRVTITKEIEVELMPSLFGPMTVEEFVAEYDRALSGDGTIEGVLKDAARMAAYYGPRSHDGLGLVNTKGSNYPKPGDVQFVELSDESEEEIVEGC